MRKILTSILLIIAVVTSCKDDKPETTQFCNLTGSTHEIDYQEQTMNIGVNAFDTEWTFALTEDWATTTTVKGDTSIIFDVHVEANTTDKEREMFGVLNFVIDGVAKADTITITQLGEYPRIVLGVDEIAVTSAATVETVTLTSNYAWEVAEKPDWIDVVNTRAFTDYEVNIGVEENTSFSYRTGSIIFTQQGQDGTDTLKVTQYGKGGLETDSLALVDLYNSANGTQWTKTWNLNEPVSSWSGVTVSETQQGERITMLDLQKNNLVGSIPESMSNVVYIENLYLNDNELTGEIPAEIGNLINLATLSLYNNKLSGEIPVSIGKMVELSRIYLQNNELSGEIPEVIGNIASLDALGLENNNLEGELPEAVGALEDMRVFAVSNNRLSGVIPDTYIVNKNATSWEAKENICPQQEGYGFTNCEALYNKYDK